MLSCILVLFLWDINTLSEMTFKIKISKQISMTVLGQRSINHRVPDAVSGPSHY